jgi:molybdopterin-containing oxidoreductase family membrane subunit
MWTATVLAFLGLGLLIFPATRQNEGILPIALLAVFIAAWIDKGMGLVIGGFIPNMFDRVTEYTPTATELAITIGVYAIGMLVLTVLYKVAIGIKEDTAGEAEHH